MVERLRQSESLVVQDWLWMPEGSEILRTISVNGNRLKPYGNLILIFDMNKSVKKLF